ncbi:MAG: Transcriptional regulatory protein OmpR [Stenotrophomonas maltophilia]|nr:MAG: Transcriptional regulatory protein OmpR [Stenotrophomonas maltophilia]
MKTRVLVVDDHADIRVPLVRYLTLKGMQVEAAATAAQARLALQSQAFDAIVLDIMLPDESGLAICRDIAQTLHTPVILLTAKAATPDRIVGLETGADDYVVKPFDPGELVARINSVIRRQQRPEPVRAAVATCFGFEGWRFDTALRELRNPHGNLVPLSEAELRLLGVFVRNPKVVFSRDQLLDLTQDGETEVFDRTIDSQVSRLRRKLEVDPRRPSLLKTSWGSGYLFTADVTPLSP